MLEHGSTKALACLFIISLAISLSSCGKKKRNHNPPGNFALTGSPETYEKLQWVAKVGRVLRNGRELSDTQVDQLSLLSKDQVIDDLMKDALFGDTVVEFNLSYLGFKSDYLLYPGQSLLSRFFSKVEFPSAISSASEIMKNGDYFKIFNLKQPMYATPLVLNAFFEEEDAGKTTEELLIEAYNQFIFTADELVKVLDDSPSPDSFCESFSALVYRTSLFYAFGIEFRSGLGQSDHWFGDLTRYCQDFPYANPLPDFRPRLKTIKENLEVLYQYLRTMLPKNYIVKSLTDLRKYDNKILKMELEGRMLTAVGFWRNLPNSSTNYNRKRAAYVLKRFFCDDLTPINVALPAGHSGDQHASDPGCQACHYKLDPMAGFFRNLGRSGVNYESQEGISFDDDVNVDRKEYIRAWRNEGNTARPWNIGYIRSISDDSLNNYSANLANPELQDLFDIIKQAPEAKKCLVKNMFKYFVGETFTLDAGYLDHLTSEFEKKAKENSAVAFKETVKSLLTSNTFNIKDPKSGECYDYRPGVDPDGLPPCKVSFVLNKNCSSCHKGAGAQGGLDLSSWTEIDSVNNKFGFPHKVDGNQLSGSETFKRIVDRLTTDDLRLRMPLDIHIEAGEREQLYLWSLEMIEEY